MGGEILKGKLILEDGTSFSGELFGEANTVGEVVFNTGMTGYQEILTDPSYCRQIVTLTYPLIGNYGINEVFMQSRKSFVRGLIAGELCEVGSNRLAASTIREFLQSENIPCLHEVDTRRVTRHIRSEGTMKGVIVPENMPEKGPIPFAQIVPVSPQPVLGTAAEAQADVRAVQAFFRQAVCLMHPEIPVPFHQDAEIGFHDVSQAIPGKCVSVTGVYIPVDLHASGMPAKGMMDAQAGRNTPKVACRHVDDLHMFPVFILPFPFVEYRAQESAVAFRRYGERHQRMLNPDPVDAGRFRKQLAAWQYKYNNFPMRPLNWCSPNQVLSAFPDV